MIGSTLSHYKITAKLGEGGMGEVYLAEDTNLDREVALKVLPEELAADPERLQRFKSEAKTVAALNHPNIVTIHSVEADEGLHFLTMERVKGKTLDQHVPAGGLPLAKLFDLAIPMADALAEAHAKGITHRDLKPANVMVNEKGQVKILDFGLAKLAAGTAEENDETLIKTRTGTVMGTVRYMSPEQARGEPADHRSDVFSLGVLLYEMATGERPFQGESSVELLSSILKDDPPSITEINSKLPNHLGRIVRRCLEKEPDKRYQSALEIRNELQDLKKEIDSNLSRSAVSPAAEPKSAGVNWKFVVPVVTAVAVVVALGWWLLAGRSGSDREHAADRSSAQQTTTAPSERPRLVVIPFENQGSADDDYFAAGMTEEITSRLAAVPGLAVVSRKSALQYAGTDKTPAEIGSELDVAYVLDGTVRWASSPDGGSRVRITPQLIDVAADTLDWSEPFDREVADVFEIQTEIAKTVVSRLGVAVLGGADPLAEERPTENFEAYAAFLRGRHSYDEAYHWLENTNAQIEAYARAVELDPDFAEAWAELVQAHVLAYHLGYDVSERRLELARQALAQADRLAPDAGETLLAHGFYHYHGFKEYEKASEFFRRARVVLVDPSDVLVAEAFVLRRLARFDEAAALQEKALETNPRDPIALTDLAETLIYAGRYAEALEASRLAQSVLPSGVTSVLYEAWTYQVWKGADGLAAARDALDRLRGDRSSWANHFRLKQFFYEGREEAVLELVNGLEGLMGTGAISYPSSLMRALALERLGQTEEARAAYLEAAETLERELERTPHDFRLHGPLGYAYAALDRRKDALASAERGHEIMPPERDAMFGPYQLWWLAVVNARLGNAEKALEQYRTLIEFAGRYSVPRLEIEIFMDPVRDHPKYKELVRDLGQRELQSDRP